MTCQDNKQFLRTVYEKPVVKASKEVKDDYFLPKWQTEDQWVDQYKCDDQSVANYDILNKTKLTAEELFQMRFKSDGRDDSFMIHCLSK